MADRSKLAAGTDRSRSSRRTRPSRRAPLSPLAYVRRAVVVIYLFLLVGWPMWIVVQKTFFDGKNYLGAVLADKAVVHALEITLAASACAVVLNTVFGIALGILLVRYDFPGKRVLGALVDLPIAVSPVVIGFALMLAYGPATGWLGGPLHDVGVQVIFTFPGIVLAVTFVSLPLVLREVIPVLREVGTDQEVAARSLGASGLQTLRRITLPSIKWAVAYGVVLTLARALGEFGAVTIVSGGVKNKTETATIAVQRMYQDFGTPDGNAYAVAFLLALIALAALAILTILRPKEHDK